MKKPLISICVPVLTEFVICLSALVKNFVELMDMINKLMGDYRGKVQADVTIDGDDVLGPDAGPSGEVVKVGGAPGTVPVGFAVDRKSVV